MSDILQRHRQTWNEKKIIRVIYTDWYRMMLADLSQQPGLTVELGGGGGNFKAFKPDVLTTDIDPQPWLDLVFDAHQMPFADGEVANLVMVDVLHHLANPVLFLEESLRVLQPGGRLLMLEPYASPFSLPVSRRFHPEPFIFNVDYFAKNKEVVQKDPWDSNQAIPQLLFFKHFDRFKKRFGDRFSIQKRERLSTILYPASGGFENKSMIPDALIPVFQGLETLLTPLRPLLAFRCYVVLEKK